jgi:hypothetical protein
MAKPLPMLKTPENTQKPQVLDLLDESRITEWLIEYGSNILYMLAGTVGILILIYAFSSGQHSKAEQEYIQAANDFTYFTKSYDSKNPVPLNDAFNRLNSLMKKHPELHAAYDGALAQTLLNRTQIEEAQPFALATLARVKSNDLPFYRDYAETTLLIGQLNFKQALENALALQQKMKDQIANDPSARSFGDELFALNLLRVAMMQQEIGDKAAEMKTWNEWRGYAGLNGKHQATGNVNPQAFRSVIQKLAIGSISLPDYISNRESLLKK